MDNLNDDQQDADPIGATCVSDADRSKEVGESRDAEGATDSHSSHLPAVIEDSTAEVKKKPDYVVGIGASAGGLNALTTFFNQMSEASQAAFIVIQHLSPSYKSMMDQLLQKQTAIPVSIAHDQEEILADHIYLAPAKCDITIANGRIELNNKPERGTIHHPIDRLFASLAEQYRKQAIAVVLSGTGGDGSEGISKIKDCDGLVVVQDPDEAEFNGMPTSAIRTQLVDVVLPVSAMPNWLATYMAHPFLALQNSDEFRQHLAQKSSFVEKILYRLNQYNGFDFREYKQSTIARRIERRMTVKNISDIADYYALIQNEESELGLLCKEILIGVTEFFRDDALFESLARQVIPDIITQCLDDEEIRVWVAGCSTGEEAYSLAILFDEALKALERECIVRLFATDVDERAISFAARGVYSAGALDKVSPQRRAKYFTLSDSEYTINDELRKMVIFAQHNLITDPPFSNMSLICCRNVLIYLQNTAQERALSFMHFALVPQGYLFLGASESLGNVENYFKVLDSKTKIFRKKPNTRIPLTRFAPTDRPFTMSPKKTARHAWSPKKITADIPRLGPDLSKLTDYLVERYAPPTLLVNEAEEILYISGDMDIFTKKVSSGSFSGVLGDILLPELGVSVSTAMYRAKKEEKQICYRAVKFFSDLGERQVSVVVSLLEESPATGQAIFAISFEQLEESIAALQIDDTENTFCIDTKKRIEALEEELSDNRERLKITVEELESTNEELQLANEELMAANEELQSTNEELQSVNEELYTVNQEYQEKIEEISSNASDLNNLLNSTNLAVIFLDNKLNIRRFTAPAKQFFNIQEVDIGRPISNFTAEVDLPNIAKHYHNVLSFGLAQEVIVKDTQGVPIQLKMLPYRNEEGLVTGVVLIFDNSAVPALKAPTETALT